MKITIDINELNDHGLIVCGNFRFPVLTNPIDEFIVPLFDSVGTDRGLKLADMRKFDAEDGVPTNSYELEAVIVYPRSKDDSPNIKRRARDLGWQTASLRQLVSWYLHTKFTDAKVIALGPNPKDENKRYSYDAVCGNAAPILNYATPGKLDVCMDLVWVDWPDWARFLLVRVPKGE